jgi:putative tricarboxylic transport membrane protein
MKSKDQISGCFFLVFSIVICASAFELNIGSFFNPGPGFVPFLSGALLGIVSIGTLVGSLFFNKNLSQRSVWKGIKWKKIVYTLGILVGYSLVMTFIGFCTSTFLLFMSLFWGIERISWWKAFLGSAVASVISYLFFVGWLQCQLPPGIVGY